MESNFFACIVWEYYLCVCGMLSDSVNYLSYVTSMVDEYESRALAKRFRAVPVHAMKAYRMSRGITPLIS